MNIYPHHVLLWVTDMGRAVKFYTETLGLPLLSYSDGFSKVGGNKFWLALHPSKQSVMERKEAEGPLVVLKSDSVDQIYEELKSKGVTFFREPYDAAPGVRVAEFYDTEGNKLSISSAE